MYYQSHLWDSTKSPGGDGEAAFQWGYVLVPQLKNTANEMTSGQNDRAWFVLLYVPDRQTRVCYLPFPPCNLLAWMNAKSPAQFFDITDPTDCMREHKLCLRNQYNQCSNAGLGSQYGPLALHVLPASVHCMVMNALKGYSKFKTLLSWAEAGISTLASLKG